ncbi:MAG TPA: helix-turn-helix domain-containing protein [Spirillospora sp.]|nr:helix-turn-helix domain-containing protein [Spirillospora sp.]
MTDLNNLLQELGFTDYEARAYIALLQQNPLNGYELAKVSGIPRPNIYKVLQKLEERGIVIRADTPNSAVYSPISPGQLTKRLGNRFKSILDAASEALESVSKPGARDYVWNIESYDAVIDQVRTLIEQAQENIIVAMWQPEARLLNDVITEAIGRNIVVQTLCLQACPQECGFCCGTVYRYPVISSRQTRWLIAVQDEADLVMADIKDNQNGEPGVEGIRTRQHYLGELASWYIRHSIALSSILSDAGDRITSLLSPDTQSLLQSLSPDEESWLVHMQRLLDQ